jgi:hypothetical protein
VIGDAVQVMRIATGIPTPADKGKKDPAAVALGRKGGKARAEGMSAGDAIARKAAQSHGQGTKDG